MKMKRFLAFLLTLLMVVGAVPAVVLVAKEAPDAPEAVEAVEALPSSYTLKGDMHMPPVDNQGNIGCCVSESEAFLQFTNAVSRYLHKINPGIDWNPSSGDTKVIFSPKWTYNFSGPGGEWVYNILVHHGAAVMADCIFYKYSSSPFGSANGYNAKSRAWDITPGIMERALQYRLRDFEIIEFSKVGQMTNTRTGKQLLERIKASIAAGNVVSVSGDAYNWNYSYRLTGAGDIGKVGEYVLAYSSTECGSGGGHQVSLVGYDDNITLNVNGVTLKGGFLMQNSWGTSFKNDGFVWIMYDALNTTSEYDVMNDSGRCATFGQYCFTDWENDVVIGHPDLMATVEITVADRECFDITLTRTDADGNTLTYLPPLFAYGNSGIHPDYDYEKMNFAGVENGSAVSGTFTLSYEDLSLLEDGKTVDDYVWGFIVNVKSGNTVKVGNAVLKNAALQELDSMTQSVTVSGSTYGSTDRIFSFSPAGKHLVVVPGSEQYTVSPAGDSKPLVNNRGSYSFSLTAAPGFTTAYAKVYANGVELFPGVTGVYTLNQITADTYVSVVGVMEDKDAASAQITAYNNAGWEYYDKQYVFVVSVSNSQLKPSIYAKEGEIGSEKYPYYFRLTINGVSYYTQPVSVYRFDNATLYRLNIVGAGFNAVADTELRNVLVEVVCQDHVIYTSTIASTTVGYTRSPAATYQVQYKLDGKTIATDAFPAGKKLVSRALPERLGFRWSWDPVLPEGMPSSNLTVNGSYERYGYVVTWVVDGKSYAGVYALGELPTFDGSTEKAATKQNTYTFTGWDPEVSAVTGDTTYTAQYDATPVIYKVTWVVGTGSFVEEYTYGQAPSFKGDTSKPSDSRYDYTFDGWDKSLRAVTKDATYTAKYIATERDRILGDTNGDGILSIQDVTVLLIALGNGSDDVALYDVNEDGTVSIQDVTKLLMLVSA